VIYISESLDFISLTNLHDLFFCYSLLVEEDISEVKTMEPTPLPSLIDFETELIGGDQEILTGNRQEKSEGALADVFATHL
jgi:hypothetical protein